MTLTKYPIGLHAKVNFFRCCSTSWNDETKEWILLRMIASKGNIKPVFVVNQNETVDMYEPNATLTDLVKTNPTGDLKIYKRQVRKKAYWMIQRTKIQKMNITPKEREDLVKELNELRDEIKLTRMEQLRDLFRL